MKKNIQGNFAVLSKIKKPLRLCKIDLPILKKNQILIKVYYTFICGSQINEWLGKKGEDLYLPHLLGHEASGKVVSTGKKIKKVKKGDKVIISWIKGKGRNFNSIKYKNRKNEIINSGSISTFSNFTIVPENRVYKIPKTFSLEKASLFGCAMPTGVGLANYALKYKINKKKIICIFGVGGIGLISLLTLNYYGYKNIIAIDKNKKNLNFAKIIGAKYTLDYKKFKKLITNNKININDIMLNIESSGNKLMMEQALINLSTKGYCIISGNEKIGKKININPYDIIFGKKIIGTIGGNISLEKNIKLFKKLLAFNKITNQIYFKKKYKLKNINSAIKDFINGRSTRPLIQI